MDEKQAMTSAEEQALSAHGDDEREDGASVGSADNTAAQEQDTPDDMQESSDNAQTQDTPDIVKTIGRTTYNVFVHFDENAKETLEDKIKRLVLADIAEGRV